MANKFQQAFINSVPSEQADKILVGVIANAVEEKLAVNRAKGREGWHTRLGVMQARKRVPRCATACWYSGGGVTGCTSGRGAVAGYMDALKARADMLWETRQLDQATECYRFAASVDGQREHLYQSWFIACRRTAN